MKVQPLQPNLEPNVEFVIQELNNSPNDVALLKFLATLDTPPETNDNTGQQENALTVPNSMKSQVAEPVNNTMNVQNVQNINPNLIPHGIMPGIYFPISTVTINYNFNK